MYWVITTPTARSADIGVVELNVFADQGNSNFRGGVLKVVDHLRPVFEIRFGTVKTETLTDCLCQMFLFHGKRRFVQVGDIESQPFLEAIRQCQHEKGHENVILIHVTLIPYLRASQEMKTKPTQASVKDLQGMGIWPDILDATVISVLGCFR